MDKLIGILCVAMFVGICMGAGMYAHWANRPDNGIYAAPSGQASFLAGTGCIVNDSKERSEQDMLNDFAFCMKSHRDFWSRH